MLHDCGITRSDDPWLDWTFDAFYRGWVVDRNLTELLILCHTPGIPIQWVFAVFKLSSYYRRKLRSALNEAPEEILRLAKENALTVQPGDGLRMLRVMDPREKYVGQVPLWTTLDLRALNLKDSKAFAQELGVDHSQIGQWRRSKVFDPLTGARIKREVGNLNATHWKGPRVGQLSFRF
jgi:hypothetical protein